MVDVPLTALMVRLLHSRCGSTLLMQLLASSDEVACDRVMPYERRYLANLVAKSDTGPALAASWRDFASRLAREIDQPRYYAEKDIGILHRLAQAGIPLRIVDIVRDPRDIYVSARAMARRLGRPQFGIRPGEPDAINATLFLCDVTERARHINTPTSDASPLFVRYEDMVADGARVAERLGHDLGLQFDLRRIAAPGTHKTASSVSASVGRWRAELDSGTAGLLTAMLVDMLQRFGYTL